VYRTTVTRRATRGITALRKALEQLPATFDARAESVADNLMFRATFKRHVALIWPRLPATATGHPYPDTTDRNRVAGLAVCSHKPGADELG